MDLEPGIYTGIEWADYLKIPYMSPSTLKHGLRSMRRLKRAIDGEITVDRATTAVGQMVHCMVAGEMDRIAIMPAYDLDAANVTQQGKSTTSKNTTYYKEQVSAFMDANRGKDIVTTEEHDTASKVYAGILRHDLMAEYIARSNQEVTVIAEVSGVKCKTRLDGLFDDGSCCWDLKCTSDVQPDILYRLTKRMRYLFQFGFHLLVLRSVGCNLQSYSMLAVEVEGDFDLGVINVPIVLLETWADVVSDVLTKYRQCRESGVWPGLYPADESAPLQVPNWDMMDAESDKPDLLFGE